MLELIGLKFNNMEKHSKDLQNIRVDRDFLWVNQKQIDAN
jgi:hypothetical protein